MKYEIKKCKTKKVLNGVLFSIFATVCMLSQSLGITSQTYAKTSIAMTPMNQRVVLIPGDKYTSSVKISNPADSAEELNFEASVGSYSPVMDQGEGIYGGADTTTISNMNRIMDWITLSTTKGVVKPGDEKTIAFTIDVPKDAPAGGQYATIIVKEAAKDNDISGNNASISSVVSIVSIIYAEVAGETIEKGDITENNMPSFMTNGNLQATAMVQNNGNVHTDAEYILQVWPVIGDEEICTNEEDPDTSLILPETERYHAQSCNLPMVGIFRAKQTVKIFNEISTLEKMIVVCPVWLMFIIVFATAALIIWLVLHAKNRKK